MNQVLNFGSLNIDRVYRVPCFVREGETLACSFYSEYPGGKGLNQSTALARAGIKVYHAGKIGADGKFLVEALEKSDVDISNIIYGEIPTGHACIQVEDSGKNSILIFPGANQEISTDEIDKVLNGFGKSTLLLLQNEISNIPYLITEGKKKGFKIAFNPSPFSENVLLYPFDKIDYLFVNEREAAQLSGKNATDEIIDTLNNKYPDCAIIMTLGAKGSMYVKNGERIFEKAYNVNAIDTTGAGDTFTGYFIASLINGIPLKKSMRYASKAAGISVTGKGASSSIPYAREVFGE